MYIRSVANISPQDTFGKSRIPENVIKPVTNRLNCIEPNYLDFIDNKSIRRMSRIIKMGVASGLKCLHDAEIEKPDAIITGTAYGCLEDTEVFLEKLIENNESLLTPTSFIQSTHNTIGAQIGLLLKCTNYNNTFVHKGHSFESALLDCLMLLKNNEAKVYVYLQKQS